MSDKTHVMDPCFYCGAGDHADGDCPEQYERPEAYRDGQRDGADASGHAKQTRQTQQVQQTESDTQNKQ